MTNLLFKDDDHFKCFQTILHSFRNSDCYHSALAYLIAFDEVARKHIPQIYNFEEKSIISEALKADWITSESFRTLTLAFNLYTGTTFFTDEPETCAVAEIFDCENAPFYIEAIKIRYKDESLYACY